MTAHIISLPPPETHRHPHTPTNNRCIATRPHQPPLRTSPHQVVLRRSLTLPNVVLSEKNATNLQVRRVASHQVRNAARCVLSLSLSEHAPLSHHPLRLPHSDESRFMEESLTFLYFSNAFLGGLSDTAAAHAAGTVMVALSPDSRSIIWCPGSYSILFHFMHTLGHTTRSSLA